MKIKQLEWKTRKIDRKYIAEAFWGVYYRVQRVNRPEEFKVLWETERYVEEQIGDPSYVGEYPSMAEAKAAAQTDFEKRVMACFETTDKSNFWG